MQRHLNPVPDSSMSERPISVRCSDCAVKRLCLPAGLSESDIVRLERVTRAKKIVKAGDCLYRAGNPFTALYAIRSGSFKSTIIAADGDTQVTHFSLPGELLGLDAYSGHTHPSYAEALEDSCVCVLPFNQLEILAQDVPTLQRHIYAIFSEELRGENEILLLLGKRSAETRLAALLINISSRYARRGYSSSRFLLSMPRTDIANYLGLTAETVSRLFSRFQKEGLIQVEGRDVKILDMVGLSELAGTHCSYDDSELSARQ